MQYLITALEYLRYGVLVVGVILLAGGVVMMLWAAVNLVIGGRLKDAWASAEAQDRGVFGCMIAVMPILGGAVLLLLWWGLRFLLTYLHAVYPA
jgi:hypothetical protein